MALQQITYNEVVTLVKNYIKTNCRNIVNYGSMESCFKPGYSVTTRYAGNDTASAKYIVKITKAVSQVSASTVDTDMTNFLNNIDASDKLTQILPASEFIDFINNMVTFCSTKLCFTVSQYSKNKYLIYYTGNIHYLNTADISDTVLVKIVAASDVNSILNSLIDVINQKIRTVACTYNVDLA